MKKSNATKRQNGFFDLGISLLVLAIGGSVALSANHTQEKRAALQQQTPETAGITHVGPSAHAGVIAAKSKQARH